MNTAASAREGKDRAPRSSKAFALFIAALFLSAGFAVMLESFAATGVSAAGVPVPGPSPVFATIAAGKIGHAPFRINNDANLAAKAAAEGWPGDGTIANPYLIQNLDINANDTGAGIFIGNVTKHFKIQGCVIQNAVSTGSSDYFAGAGILVFQSANGTINGCYCSHNNFGVMVRHNSKDMTITNNVLTHNTGTGLYLNLSDRVLVQGNDCSRCNNNGIYLDNSDHVSATQNNVSLSPTGLFANSCDFLSVTWNKAVGSGTGMTLYYCVAATVENNTIYRSSGMGISLQYADNSKVHNNTLFGCSIEFSGGSIANFASLTITDDNSVNGKKVMYYKNIADASGIVVPTSAGEVIAANVTNLHISGLSIGNVTGCVMLYRTSGVSVTGCTFAYTSYGIYAYIDPLLTVSGNTFVNARVAVMLRYSDGSMITGNTINRISQYGLQVWEDDNCLIANNVFSAPYTGTYAVYLDQDSTNDTLWSNQMINCGVGGPIYYEELATHHITVNNTVNGKQLVYLANVDLAWASVGTNIGQLLMVNATRVTVDSVQIGNLSEPVEIVYSDNITLTNSFFGYCNYGVWSGYSENITIDTCAFSNGGSSGVMLEDTTNCVVQSSMITSFSYDIYIEYGSGYRILNNRLSTVSSSAAVYAYSVSNGLIDNNNCSGSSSYGLYFSYAVSGFVVSNNNLSGVSYGVYSYIGTGNTYIANKMYYNYYDVYEYYGTNDKFYSNTMMRGFYLGGNLDYMKTIEIASNNTVYGKPVYMYRNGDFSATTVPADAGQIIVVNVTGLSISGITFTTPTVSMVYVNSISGVTITGCTFNAWNYGIYLEYCTGINVLSNVFYSGSYAVYVNQGSGNRIEGNNFSSSSYSVYLAYSPNNLVKNNDFVQDYDAMYIYSSTNSRIFDNRMYKTSIYLAGSRDTFVTQNIPVNNTVNGKKVYYYVNQNMNNASVPSNAGEVILGNVSNVLLSGLVMNNASIAVLAGYCKNVKVLNCDLRDSRYYAVYMYYSTGCTISGCAFDRDSYGVYLYYSSWNTISGNKGKSINNYGVYCYYSDANTFSGNYINSTYIAVYLSNSLRNAVLGNTFNYTYYGVYLYNAKANYVHANSITYSRYYGVYMSGSSYSNLITANNVEKSSNYAVYINSGSDSNMLYANRFARNNGATTTYNPSHIQAYDNDANAWNSTAHSGNLWTDWLFPDANHDSIVDQPYVLAGSSGSKDYYPLSDIQPPVLNITAPLNGATFVNPHVNVTWTAHDNDSGLLYVEVKVGSGAWQNASLNPNATVTLTASGNNVISVRAWDKAGNSVTKTVTAVLQTVPAAITDLHAASSTSGVTLTWTAPYNGSSPLTHYYIYRSTTSGSFGAPIHTMTPSGSAMIYTDSSGLVSGTRYYYVVKAENSLGNSTASNEATVVFGGQPDQVTGVAATGGSGSIVITWTAPADHGSPITKYVIYRSLTSTGGTVYANTTTTTFTDTTVNAGQTYYYWVVAQNANGASILSAEAHASLSGGGTTDNTVLLIAGVLVVIVLVAGIAVALMRRKK